MNTTTGSEITREKNTIIPPEPALHKAWTEYRAVNYRSRQMISRRVSSSTRNSATLALAITLHCSVLAVAAKSDSDWQKGVWRIGQSWTAQHENRFEEFVGELGSSRAKDTNSLLKSPENRYRARNPPGLSFYSDCADLPYILRAYFSYMNNLPFSWIDRVKSADGSGDIRYSKNGNLPRSRRVVKDGERLSNILREISNSISTATFRIRPGSKDSTYQGDLFPDHFSPRISRTSVRSGTIVYDPNGHVAIVFKVESSGRLLLMDGHPDNSITRIVYGRKFARSRPNCGAGFKNWRKTEYAEKSRQFTGTQNSAIADFDLVQYFGTDAKNRDWRSGVFVMNGHSLDYYDFIRSSLAEGNLKYDPIEEARRMLESLRADVLARKDSVDSALRKQLHRRRHPSRLPENIYGTHGEWETYSTPARDARLKTSFYELRIMIEKFLSMARERSPRLDYSGGTADLGRDLLAVYDEVATAPLISYRRGDRSKVDLSLEDIEDRLFLLSFDPYHSPELRWGAKGTRGLIETGRVPPESELSSGDDNKAKLDWYIHEQRLRNQIERRYSASTAFSLQDLKGRPEIEGNGVDNPPAIDVRKLLEEVSQQH